MLLCLFTVAVIETDLVYPVGVDNNKIITRRSAGIGASITNTMAELDA
jgi:hypothetical protein